MNTKLLLAFLLLIGFSYSANWTMNGDSVYWTQDGRTITAYPATSRGLITQTQYVNFTSTNSNQIHTNLSFVFHTPITNGHAYLWANTSHPTLTQNRSYVNTTFQLNGVINFTLTTNPCTVGEGNAQNPLRYLVYYGANASSAVACFATSKNTSNNYTLAYWATQIEQVPTTTWYMDWQEISGSFQYSQFGENYVHTINNVGFDGSTNHITKFVYDVQNGASGKFDIYAHAGSPACVVAGQCTVFVELDPWFNSTWNKRLIVSKTISQVGSILNYTFMLDVNSTYNLTGWSNLTITYTNPSTGAEVETGFYYWNLTKIGGWANPTKAPWHNWSFTDMNGTLAIFYPNTIPTGATSLNFTIYNGSTSYKSYLQSAFLLADDFEGVGLNSTKWTNVSSNYWNQDGTGYVKNTGDGTYPSGIFASGINISNFEAWAGLYIEGVANNFAGINSHVQTLTRTPSTQHGQRHVMVAQVAPDRIQSNLMSEGGGDDYGTASAACVMTVTPRENYYLSNGTNFQINDLDTSANQCFDSKTSSATAGGFFGLEHIINGQVGFDFVVVRNYLNGTENTTGLTMETQGVNYSINVTGNYTQTEYSLYNYTHSVNITFAGATPIVITPTLTYNGTSISPSLISLVNGTMWWYYSYLAFPPVVTVNSSVPVAWSFEINYTANGANLTQTSGVSYNFDALPIGLFACGNLTNTTTINYTFYDETTLAVLNATMTSTYTMHGGVTGSQTTSFSITNTTAFVCIYPPSLNVSVTAIEGLAATGYSARNYFQPMQNYWANSHVRSLTLLNSSSGTSIVITVSSANGQALTNYTVMLYRYSVASNNHNLTFIGLTDSAGQTVAFVQAAPALYQVVVLTPGGVVASNITNPDATFCSNLAAGEQCVYNIIIGGGSINYYGSTQSQFNTGQYCSFNNATKVLLCNYTGSGSSSVFTLQSINLTLFNGAANNKSIVYTNSTAYSSSPATVSLNLSGLSGYFGYQLVGIYSGNISDANLINAFKVFETGSVQLSVPIKFNFGSTGWFMTAILLLAICFASYKTPAVMIMAAGGTVILASIIPIISLSPVSQVALVIITLLAAVWAK